MTNLVFSVLPGYGRFSIMAQLKMKDFVFNYKTNQKVYLQKIYTFDIANIQVSCQKSDSDLLKDSALQASDLSA